LQKAAEVFLRFGAPTKKSFIEFYEHLAEETLKVDHKEDILIVKELLFQLVGALAIEIAPRKLYDLHWIFHLKELIFTCKMEDKLVRVCAKQAISLLRYIDVIDCDDAFLEAGQSSKVRQHFI
jgi:hypothetical protein